MPTKRIDRMAKRKTFNIPWGLIAFLSLVIMIVFFYISPLVVLIAIPFFLVSVIVLFHKWITFLEKAVTNPFDDYGYC